MSMPIFSTSPLIRPVIVPYADPVQLSAPCAAAVAGECALTATVRGRQLTLVVSVDAPSLAAVLPAFADDRLPKSTLAARYYPHLPLRDATRMLRRQLLTALLDDVDPRWRLVNALSPADVLAILHFLGPFPDLADLPPLSPHPCR